jgi:hypothetical protein
MNDKLVPYTFSVFDPADDAAVGALALYFMVPFHAYLVYASVAPFEDDADATMDLNNGETELIAALACATKATPGEWAAKGHGGTNDPIEIAAGSELTVDFNDAAAANRFDVQFCFLAGETWG